MRGLYEHLGRPPRGKFRVRCLGPGMPEHSFLSADPRYNRVCERCQAKLRVVSRAQGGLPEVVKEDEPA